MAGRRGRGVQSGGEFGRPMYCFTCGGFGHVSAQCPSDFQGCASRVGSEGIRLGSVLHNKLMFQRMSLSVLKMGMHIIRKVTTTNLMQRHMQMKVSKHMMTLMWVMNKFQAFLVL